MKCPTPPEMVTARSVCNVLQSHGKECYMVGGSVRDLFLGKEVHDLDLTTNATPTETTRIFTDAGYKVIPTGIKHGTVTVLFGNEREPIEITTYRTEATYSDHRHPDAVKFATRLEDDLVRRDFTINAMALDPTSNEIRDIDGQGRRDIQQKVIRAVGDPNERFAEDPLRMFRACRFKSKLEFEIDPATERAIRANTPLTKFLSPERIRDELMKTLGTSKPSTGIDCFVKNGLFDRILPEIKELVGLEQRSDFHTFDAYTHTLKTVDSVPPEKLLVRLAALFHDIGKPAKAQLTEKGMQFIHHEKKSATIFKEIADRLRLSGFDTNVKIDTDHVKTLIRNHMRFYDPKWRGATVRKLVNAVGSKGIDDLLTLQEADLNAGIKAENTIPQFRERLESMREDAIPTSMGLKDLAVKGGDVMRTLKIPPSPAVGKALNCLLDRVIEDPTLNTKDQLIDILREQT